MRLYRTNTHYNDDETTTVTMLDISWNDLRYSRDICLANLDSYYLPDRWTQLSSDRQTELNEYRQFLRDLPQENETANSACDSWTEYIFLE